MKKDNRKYYIIIVNENIEKIIETHDTEIKALERLDFIGTKWNIEGVLAVVKGTLTSNGKIDKYKRETIKVYDAWLKRFMSQFKN